jgi:hypothetical protein
VDSGAGPKVWGGGGGKACSLPGIEPQLLGGPFCSLVTVLTEISWLFCLSRVVELGTVFAFGRWINHGADARNRNLAINSVLLQRIPYYLLPDISQLRPEC